MKLVVAGKGGSGKTSISGTLARVLARDGRRVLAIDADSNPNLSLTLGIPAEQFNTVPTLPGNLLQRGPDGFELSKSLDEIRSAHSLEGPDGVNLLVMAHPKHAGTGCLCSMHATVRTVIEVAEEGPADFCILDTEASPEHLSRGTAMYADAMLLVVEPYFKSLETGRRMAALGLDLGLPRVALLANKIRDDRDLAAVTQFAEQHDLDLAGVIPFDATLNDAERAGLAPFDHDPQSPMVLAVTKLASRFA